MAKSKPATLAPVRKMVPLDKPPRRVRILDGKPWVFEADHLFVHDVQAEMGRSLFDVYLQLHSAMGGEGGAPKPPPMDIFYQLAYHLTASHREDLFEREAVEVPFRRFLRLLGVASAKAQAELVSLVMGLIGEAMAGEAPAEGNAEEPAPATGTAPETTEAG